DAAPLRHAMHRHVEAGCLLQDGFETAGALRARDLEPVFRAVGETLLGRRELVQVPRRQSQLLERAVDAHVGLSCTFNASPSRSASAAKAAACSSRGKEWLTSGLVSSNPAAKSSVTHRHAFREAPKTPCTR